MFTLYWIGLSVAGLLIVAICGYQNDRRNAEYMRRIAEYMRLSDERQARIEDLTMSSVRDLEERFQ